MPGNAHHLKSRIARAALRAAELGFGGGVADPLAAVGRLGDPMQPVAAGMALGASRAGCDVLLAGGSQMVAVAALMRALTGPGAMERMAIGTTRWIVQDPAADVPGLTAEVSHDLPLLAVNLDFSASRHSGLRAYERFLVKEGVGAGGACLTAMLASGESLDLLHRQIDAVYDALLGRLTNH
jgi:NaMN:DMB phosphoribosyltransferase